MNLSSTDVALPDILIIDDDSTQVLVLHKGLAGMARIRFAADGEQALSMVKEKPPSLILLDLELPGINGFEVCAQLKANQQTADIPILFITSRTESGIEEKVFEAGAADYISKPINPHVVKARVQIHLAYRQAMQMLSEQARIDSMTGIANRRSFDEELYKEWQRSHRLQQPLSLLLIDIDEFKKYNDYFGHRAGDDCLKSVAKALRYGVKRPTDFVARYGGEEFAVVIPDTDAQGAKTVAQELLNAVEHLNIPHVQNASHPNVTISIGGCTTHPKGAVMAGINEWAIVEAADSALYESKRGGRNQFTLTDLTYKEPLDK